MDIENGWTETTLGKVCDINPPKPKLAGVPDDTAVLFVPMAAVDEVSGEIVSAERRELGDVRKKSYKSFTTGDVLFAKITPCMENGKAAVVPAIDTGIGFGSTEFHVLRPRGETSARLIWHFVRQPSFRRVAEANMTGTVGQMRVPVDFVETFPITLPPPGLQEQLVRTMDGAGSAARSAREHLSNCRRALKRFRGALLAAACSGRLTAEWREIARPDDDAQDIITAIAARRNGKQRQIVARIGDDQGEDLPDGWCWAPLGFLVDVATGATPLRAQSDYYGGSIPWVTSGAVNAGIITKASEAITPLAIKETNAKVFPTGTLLVAMYGEGQTRGRVAELGIDAATNQAVAALLFDEVAEELRAYLRLFLLENYERIRRQAFGGVQPNLSLGVIKETPVPLPPRSEQAEIVNRASALLDMASAIERRMESTRRQVSRSADAMLTRMFAS